MALSFGFSLSLGFLITSIGFYTFVTAAYLLFFVLREILQVFPMTSYVAWNLRLWPQVAFFAIGFSAAGGSAVLPMLRKDHPVMHSIYVLLFFLGIVQAAIMSVPL